MEIYSHKIELPYKVKINLDSNDIVQWFETASTSEIQYAIHEIGRILSERDEELPFENVRNGISGLVSPQSKDFWKSLVEAME